MTETKKEALEVTYHIEHFNLQQIADSGQCFLMEPAAPHTYCLLSSGRYAHMRQDDKHTVILTCSPGDQTFWESYLDFSTDYSSILASVNPTDTYLSKAAVYGEGIRILRQDPWEMIITFIISQQKTIPKIREAIKALSKAYGTCHTNFLGEKYWAFPTPIQLSRATLDELKALKLGYRAKYIYQTCQDAVSQKLNLSVLCSQSYPQAMSYLMQFYGIGEKVANCICLFGLHHVEAFPVDTWIQKILLREYWRPEYEKLPKSQLYSSIVQEHFSAYKDSAGVMQQYIFFYERSQAAKD